MAKKMYDILPPKVARKVEAAVAEMGMAPKPKRSRSAKKPVARVLPPKPLKKKFPAKELFIGGAVICALLGTYLFITLPSVDIAISPIMSQVKASEKLVADKNAASVSTKEKSIPARFLEETRQATENFDATGSASNDGKASGSITIYNKVSPAAPLVLKAGTHFLSDSGKYFVSLDRVTIPAMQGKTAGSVKVAVQAEEAGDGYNIGPSKFSVPKLSGTVYYYGIWAESTAAMAGGKTGTVKKVTADDLANAKDFLTKKLLAQAEEALRTKLSADDVVLDNAIAKTTVDASADAKAGAVQNQFAQTASVKVSFLVFSKKEVGQYIKSVIEQNLPEGKSYLASSLEVNPVADALDMQAGTITLTAAYQVATYGSMDPELVKSRAQGKDQSQIEQLVLVTYPGLVAKTTVSFWPFWVSAAPENPEKIHVSLDVSQ